MKKISGSFVTATLSLFVAFAVLFSYAGSAFASATATSATLNGSGSAITVAAGSTITVVLNVTTTGSGIANDWNSTAWRISTTAPGSTTCVDTPDHSGASTYSESFSITAPATSGTYNVYLIPYNGNSCASGTGNTLTLTNRVIVTPPVPAVSSINRAGTNPTAAATVSWTVNFSQSVTGVDATDFALVNTGLSGSPAIDSTVTGSGSGPYTVTATTGTGSGTLGLNLVDNDSILGGATPLGGAGAANGNFTGQVYAVDRTGPTISFGTPMTSPTNDATPTLNLSSSEAGSVTFGGSCNTGIPASVSITSGAQNISLPLLGEGTRSDCTITATDAAGNIGNTLNIPTFVVDVTPPIGQTLSYLDGFTDLPSVEVTYGVGTDAQSSVVPATSKIYRRQANLTAGACGTFPTTYTLLATDADGDGSYVDSTLADQRCYQYAFRVNDAAGNFSATTTSAAIAKIDGSAPIFTVTSPANNATINSITTSSDITYSLNEALSIGSISMTWTGGVPGTDQVCTLKGTALATGAHTINMSDTTNGCQDVITLVDGAIYTFTFAGSDQAFNLATPVSRTNVTLDSSAPAVTIAKASGQADPTATSPINFTVTFSESVTGFTNVDVTLSGTEPGSKTVTVSGGPMVYNVAVSGMTAVGSVTAAINANVAADAAGNTNSAAPSPDTVNFDNAFHQPGASTQPGGSTVTNINNVFSSDNQYAVYDAGTDIGVYSTFNLPTIPAGATINGVEVVIEGNRSSSRTADIFLSWNGGTNSVSKPLAYSSSADASITLGGASDTWTRTWSPQDFTNGNFRLTLDPIVATGNLSIDQIRIKVYYTPDTSAPSLSEVTAVPTATNDATPNYTFTSSEVGSIQYSGDCSSVNTTTAVGSNTITLNTLTDGLHNNCQIIVTDAAGNPSSPLNLSAFTVDTLAPASQIDSATDGGAHMVPLNGVTNSGSITVAFSATDTTGTGVASSQCKLDAGAYAPCTSPVSYTSIADGTHTVSVSSTDNAGNVENTATFTWTVDTTAPVVSVPADIPAEATSPAGASVDFASSALDSRDGVLATTCSPLSATTFAIGDTLVTCSATDAAGNTGTASFHVIVSDTIDPALQSVPADFSVEATGADGAIVTYTTPTATDAGDSSVAVSCLPVSGTQFALGPTLVICTATDDSSNSSTASFTVTVVDTTAPTITVPADIGGVEATSNAGAFVTYLVPSATDLVDGTVTVSCDKNSGDTFAFGETTVHCSATDAAANTSNKTFKVTVVDTTAPTVTVPSDITVEAIGVNTPVPFSVSATDTYAGAIVPTCDAISGQSFAVGTTLVSCTASDGNGNTGNATFNIIVKDETAPVITVVGEAEVTVEGGSVYADAGATATDLVDGDLTTSIVTVNPVNTGVVGDYTVTYNVNDAHGNAAVQKTRLVHVVDTTAPVIVATPADITTEATGVTTVVSWTNPTATDNVDGTSDVVTCAPASSTGFVVGVHTITCNTHDAQGNTALATTFTVTVTDHTAPTIDAHGNVTKEATGALTIVDFTNPTAHDLVDGDLATVCTPVSGTSFTVGTTPISCTVTDSNGNASTSGFDVNVTDSSKPVITLTGSATINLGTGDAYSEEGAMASDLVDGTFAATVGGDVVNTAVSATYVVTYNATDSHGNAADQVTRSVIVSDDDAPVITRTGDAVINLGTGDTYIELGATAVDNVDGDISANILTTGTVNPAVPGTYTIHYNVSDAAGNPATEVTRDVVLADDDAPVIALNGVTPTEIEVHAAYLDLGASATDNVDLSVTVNTSGSVNADLVGEYTLTYTATDSAGNAALPVTRVVKVKDTTKPTLTLNGVADVTIEVGSSYTDAGAVANDNYDAETPVSTPDAVNTATAGNYTLHYNYTDANGNVADEITRVVHVTDTTIPVITVTGVDPQIIEVGGSYSELGATVADNYDSGLVAIIDITGLNLNVVGEYVVKYDATDSAGNHAVQKIRSLKVVDTTVPTITLNGDAEVTVELHGTYTDAGATAHDNYDADAPVAPSGLVDSDAVGDYTLTYNFTDANGNAALPVTRIVHVTDTVAPPTPVIEGSTGLTNNNDVAFNITDSEEGVTFECKLDGAVYIACTPIQAYADLADGEHTFYAKAKDASGNYSGEATRTVTVDATAPTVIITNPGTTGPSGTISFTATDGTAKCSLDGGAETDCTSATTHEFTALTTGEHTFHVTVTDAAGNVGGDTINWTVDASGPVVSIDSGPVNASTILVRDGSFTFSSVDAATYSCDLDGTITSCTTPFSFTNLADGSHTFSVSGTDTLGNTGAATTRTFTVDATAPVLSAEQAASFTTTSATITWTTDHPATSRVVYDTVSHNPVTDAAPNYGYANSTTEDTSLTTSHSVTVTGLNSNTTYYFRPVSHGSPEAYGTEVSGITLPIIVEPTEGTLTVTKIVSGGSKVVSDFPLFVGETPVVSGEAHSFTAGTYQVSETPNVDYVPAFSGSCVADPDNTAHLAAIVDWKAKKGALIAAINANPGDPSNSDKQNLIVDIDAKILALLSTLTASVQVSVGQDVSCIITNTYVPAYNPEGTATLVVNKIVDNTAGGTKTAAQFSYQLDGGTGIFFEAVDATHGTKSQTVEAGAHMVVEVGANTENYVTTYGGDCDSSGHVSVGSGETKTCTITNTYTSAPPVQEGSLKVIKNAIGDNFFHSFTFTGDTGTFTIFTFFGHGSKTFNHLTPGNYTVTENSKSGWTQTSSTCANVQVVAGQTATCSFTNTKNPPPAEGKLKIIKKTIGGDGRFFFEVYDEEEDNVADVSIRTWNGKGSKTVSHLAPGTYSVSESAKLGWTETSNTCVNVEVTANHTSTCIITNTKDSGDDDTDTPETGKIVVQKVTVPGGDTTSFEFTASYDADGFVLADGEQNVADALTAGIYTVSENSTDGWASDGGVCASSLENTEQTPGAINLHADETVTCVFTNTQVTPTTGSIVVKKVTDPSGDTTDFTFTATYDADGFTLADGESNVASNLPAGTYSVSEGTLAENWAQTSAVCDDGSQVAAIELSAGETVTCTFTNKKSIPVPTPTPTSNGGGNGGGGGGNGPIAGSLGGGAILPQGQVLGASTSATATLPELPRGCSALLNGYMRKGKSNDFDEVKKLQKFLNERLQADLPVTGFFGNMTDNAVKKFQNNHFAEVLKPWGIDTPTGYVYKTTQRWINLMSCSSLNIPMPELN